MDNLSGEANWFGQDVVEEVKEIEEIKPHVDIRNNTLLKDFRYQAHTDYKGKPNKKLGDIIVHLDIINNLLNN